MLNRWNEHETVILWTIFLTGLLVRVLAIQVMTGFNGPLQYDGIGYNLLATNILKGRGLVLDLPYPTASRVPGYPLFLAGIFWIFDHHLWIVRVLQALMSAFTCVLIYKIGRTAINPVVGTMAGVGAIFYPLFLYMAGLFYSETLAMFLLMLAIYFFILLFKRDHWGYAILSGALLALTTLTNPLSALLIPLLLIGLVIFVRPFKKSFVNGIIIGLTCIICISPWIARNYYLYGRFIPLSSLAGSNLWSGNNPFADGGFVYPYPEYWSEGDPPDYEYLGWSELGEADSSQRFSTIALAWIKNNPDDFVTLLPKKLLRLWSPVSYGRQFSRYAASWQAMVILPPYLFFFALALAGAIAGFKYWPGTLPLYASVLSCNLAALVYYGATRYSISMAPALIIFASLAVIAVLRRIAGTSNEAISSSPIY